MTTLPIHNQIKNHFMKTIILLSFSLVLTATAFAQINKGQFLIGGSINFESTKDNYSNYDSHESTDLFISPNIGYFIN